MHLRLRLAELGGERGQTHRLPGGRHCLDDLAGHHDRLNEFGIARTLFIFGAIERLDLHGTTPCWE